MACRLAGWLGRRFLGQTQVVMEMVAGVALGPSLLGLLAPELQRWLFPRQLEITDGVFVPHPSMAVLFALSQLGLVLFMFLVGLELDFQLLRNRLGRAGLISGAGILVPFALGGLLALWLLDRDGFYGVGVTPLTAVLFLGASMSITAFPMLARILRERGLARTSLGTVTLAAGSLDDALAWCLLAVVLATAGATPVAAWLTLGGAAVFVFVMLVLVRPRLGWLAEGVERPLGTDRLTVVLAIVTATAFLTDSIGIYAIFGAFVAGIVMPRGVFAEAVAERIEGLTVTLLLPIFFVYSGLATEIGLVDTPALWLLTLIVVLVATLGKGVACTLAARLGGESWRESAIVGTLMNARGLMELILLNVGLEQGIISPTLFTILVLMAVVTTLVTSPIYNLLSRGEPVPS